MMVAERGYDPRTSGLWAHAHPETLPGSQKQPNLSNKIFDEVTLMGITTAMKLFIRPFTGVMPDLVDVPPYQTERVRSEQADIGLPHTPWTWLEPLRIYGVEYDYPAGGAGAAAYAAGHIDFNAPDMPHRFVMTSRTMRNEATTPSLTNLAVVLKEYLSTPLTSSGLAQARALQPVRFQKDLQSLAALLELLPNDNLCYYEEAAMLRMALLHLTVALAEHLARMTSVVQQIFANCVPSAVPVVAWSALPADAAQGKRSPNIAANTVHMCAIGIDLYVQWASGAFENRNANWVGANQANTVIVPVAAEWMGAEWLMGYIASFTTTGWWNFSRTATFTTVNQRTNGANIANSEIRTLVEACTVVCEGRYDKILLVVTNRSSDSFGPQGVYYIRSSTNWSVPIFTGQAQGVDNNNFSERMYTWLGRAGVAQNHANLNVVLPRAWKQLCTTVALPGMADRVWSMASELSYTRRIPATVTPGQIGANARRHDGLHALEAAGIAIDGTNMVRWDVADHTGAEVGHRVRAEQTLRHSPLGVYPSSVSYIATGAGHDADQPSYAQPQYYAPQYQVNTATGIAKVAIACGLYVKDCNERIHATVIDACVYSQGLASLLLGVAGWIHGAAGLNITVVSGWANLSNMAPAGIGAVTPEVSDNFVVDITSSGVVGLGTNQIADDWWNAATLIQKMYDLDNDQDVVGYSNLNVPFWYVSAVMEKLDIKPGYNARLVAKRFTGGLAAQGRKLVYTFTQKNAWNELYMAESDLCYEDNHWHFATVNTLDAALTLDEMFWFPDAYFDVTRMSIGNGVYGIALPMQNHGIISITMSGGDYTTQFVNNAELDIGYMRTELWGQLPVQLDRPTSIPVVIGGLRYPDPFWEWLWDAANCLTHIT